MTPVWRQQPAPRWSGGGATSTGWPTIGRISYPRHAAGLSPSLARKGILPSRQQRPGLGPKGSIRKTTEPSSSMCVWSKDHGSMRIAGIWHQCDDGIVRPVLLLSVSGPAGIPVDETFLIDSGADRTVFSAALLHQIGGATAAAPLGLALAGIGGTQAFAQVQAVLKLPRDDGGMATVRGNFAAFTDPTATALRILGRDVLYNFDIILSRQRREILLLAPPCRYQVHTT